MTGQDDDDFNPLARKVRAKRTDDGEKVYQCKYCHVLLFCGDEFSWAATDGLTC